MRSFLTMLAALISIEAARFTVNHTSGKPLRTTNVSSMKEAYEDICYEIDDVT